MYRLISLIILLNYSVLLISQELFSDPSFEEETSNSTWWSCKEHSTPDAQPGNWNIEISPFQGNQYVSIVTRGPSNFIPSFAHNTAESVIQVLQEPGLANETYVLTYHAAFSEDFLAALNFGSDTLRFDLPIKLEIWLGSNNDDCNFEYIGTSTLINHSEWKEYRFEFTSNKDFENILFQAKTTDDNWSYFGNALIDNSSLKKKECYLNIPNIFTPDGDGINDVFDVIPSECVTIKDYSFSIFNRWGQEVFQTNDITEGWDGLFKGDSAVSDVYVYVINFSENGIPSKIHGDITLIR